MSAGTKQSRPKSAADDSTAIPPGYKRTEVGVIPEDWRIAPLAQLSAFITKGATPTTYGFRWEESGVLFLRSECVSASGLDLAQSMHISKAAHATLGRSDVRDGDILITITGNVGRVVLLAAVGLANINQHIARIRIVAHDVDGRFVFYYLSQDQVRQTFETITTGQAYPQISLVQVRHARVALPPPPEQRAIAEALSDVDGLLGALEALIAKKRAIKQAAMQQLLTGKTRLPGFSGPWETVALDDVTARIAGFWGSSELSAAAPYKVGVIRAGDISPLGTLTDCAARYFNDVELSKAACRTDDVVITVSGNGLGKTWLVDDQAHLAASNFVRILRQKHGRAHGPFLAAVLKGGDAQKLLAEHTATSAYPNLHPTFFSSRWLDLPPLGEQAAIATVLSDMDAELAALENRRDKTRAIKQGMMQQLLTGRVRLVEPEIAA